MVITVLLCAIVAQLLNPHIQEGTGASINLVLSKSNYKYTVENNIMLTPDKC